MPVKSVKPSHSVGGCIKSGLLYVLSISKYIRSAAQYLNRNKVVIAKWTGFVMLTLLALWALWHVVLVVAGWFGLTYVPGTATFQRMNGTLFMQDRWKPNLVYRVNPNAQHNTVVVYEGSADAQAYPVAKVDHGIVLLEVADEVRLLLLQGRMNTVLTVLPEVPMYVHISEDGKAMVYYSASADRWYWKQFGTEKERVLPMSVDWAELVDAATVVFSSRYDVHRGSIPLYQLAFEDADAQSWAVVTANDKQADKWTLGKADTVLVYQSFDDGQQAVASLPTVYQNTISTGTVEVVSTLGNDSPDGRYVLTTLNTNRDGYMAGMFIRDKLSPDDYMRLPFFYAPEHVLWTNKE